MTGKLTVITGPMFAGKSEELMRRVHRAQIAGKRVILVKPEIDIRYSASEIVSHNGRRMGCITLSDDTEALDRFVHGYESAAEVFAFDESQFYSGIHFLDVIRYLANNGKEVIVAGLDLDANKRVFGKMHYALAYAEEVVKLTAVCNVCGADAPYTKRISEDEGQVVVGGTDKYEARCRLCYNS